MGFFSSDLATHLPSGGGVRTDGAPFEIPADLDTPATLVVLTFEDGAAPLSGQWARLGERIAEDNAGLSVLELIVFPPRMKMLGDMALLGLRARAAADGSAHRLAVVFAKAKPIRKELGIRSMSSVTALLVRPDGEIVWRGDDAIDLHEIESLEPQVQALLEGAGSRGQPAGT